MDMKYLSLFSAVSAITLVMCIAEPASSFAANYKDDTYYRFNSLNAQFTGVVDVSNLTKSQKDDLRCLSLNIYHEARGSTLLDKMGVALVAINRQTAYNKSICSVVYERRWIASQGRWSSQFSWNTPSILGRRLENTAWDVSQKIAWNVLHNNVADITKGAIYFHEKNQRMGWDRSSYNRNYFGSHVFFNLAEDGVVKTRYSESLQNYDKLLSQNYANKIVKTSEWRCEKPPFSHAFKKVKKQYHRQVKKKKT
jgi:hypothetical protein